MGGYGSGRTDRKRHFFDEATELPIRPIKEFWTNFLGGREVWSEGGPVISRSRGFPIARFRGRCLYPALYTYWRQDTRMQAEFCFESMPCHYGGFRLYFICPGCGRRRESLYLYRDRCSCRSCLQLAYDCENAGAVTRAHLQKRKYEGKLVDGFFKPKRMRYATFDRIRGRIEHQQKKINAALLPSLLTLQNAVWKRG